ncbi:MAG: LamG domain-containing protein, partial [Woeseiaceae bacterium]
TVDTSGVGAPITLNLTGTEWVNGGGLRIVSGKAEASAADSRKLFDMITPANEYTVEAWIIPDNNAQDGPARIVSYSLDTQVRNFTMGQNAIYYQLRNRSAATNANGSPPLEALDPQVDTSLTHVAMTFDDVTGRSVFINGQLAIEENVAGDTLDWLDTQLLVLGNEVTNDRLWQGTLQLVAIHNRALSDVEVQQNFDAGAGEAFTMHFDISNVVGEPAFIDMRFAQLDSNGYLFARPLFVSDATGVMVKNIRVGINGSIPVAAQPFRRIDMVAMQSGEELSPLGAVIPAELGIDDDRFHLEFEMLGNMQGLAEMAVPSAPPLPVPDAAEPEFGLRTFAQLNDAMSDLTGVDKNQNAVLSTYSEVRDSLPSTHDLTAFGTAQQIAIQRLASSYCGVVVQNNGSCDALFGNCAVDGNAKDQVASALYNQMIGANIADQPDLADVTTEVVRMIDDLGCTNGCNGAEGETVLQATCAAVLSSAAITVN